MKKPSEVEDQMCSSSSPSSLCLLKQHLFVIYLFLALCLIFIGFFSSLFTSILLTFAVLIISTVAHLAFTKQKLVLKRSDHEVIKLQDEVIQEEAVLPETQEADEVGKIHEEQLVQHAIKSPDLSSESESLDLSSTSEDSDAEWPPFPNNMDRIPECSDCSISDDDENLIEIPLSGDYRLGLKEEPKLKISTQMSLDSGFPQEEGLLELLAEINEMNEEDNLIEIDISMGSIKCSSLEIEA